MSETKWHVVIPGVGMILTVGGIILLDALGKQPPDVLTGLATAFGVWATGGALAGSANKVDPHPPIQPPPPVTPPNDREVNP